METAKVLRLTDAVDDVRYDSALDCLERVVERVKNGYKSDPDFRATGVVVLLLDQSSGKYHMKRECSSMKTSEMIALLTVAQHQELKLLEPSVGE